MNNTFDDLTKSLEQSVTRRQSVKKFGADVATMVTICLLLLAFLMPRAVEGAALAFDGTGGYVSIATTGSLFSTFTVELWAKPNDNSPNATLCVLGSRRPSDFSFDFIFWQGNLLHGDIGNN